MTEYTALGEVYMSVEQSRVLVVLGMHRSGTSVVTRALEVLGVSLGNNLMPPAENNNEKGFFEDLDIHHFNTRLLGELGTAWDRLDEIDSSQFEAPSMAPWREEARDTLRAKLTPAGVFAFKDPQTCLLLPFWQRVLSSLPVDVHYLICFRNPLSVADSLAMRDGIAPARAQLLWARYLLAALRDSTGRSRLLVDYDSMMDQPARQLSRIARQFGLSADETSPSLLESFEREFLSEQLRHARHNAAQLSERRLVLRPVEELHNLMCRVADDRLDSQDNEVQLQCARLFAELDDMRPLARAVDELDQDRLQERMELSRLDHELLRQGEELDDLRTKLAVSEAECSTAWHMHEQVLQDRHQLAAELVSSLHGGDELRAEIARIYASRSWRLMRPLRGLRRHGRNPAMLLRRVMSEGARCLWWLLPITVTGKQKLKYLLFSHGGWMFAGTRAYRDWQMMSENGEPLPREEASGPLRLIDEPLQHVPKLLTDTPCDPPVRLIAFYLPQFHPIAENDEWWGKGFTEWTNVRPAQPQYEGHYQPHVPGELGYYDLLDDSTQHRQVELAKRYGVGGFCFYFYWFAGKRLLEAPIERYLEDRSLDLPFCLCWANENWSRRWDGLDSQILIGQSHSAEDDLAFIDHVARYMRDERYIRVDGRPLLLVYRPSLLPDARATAMRWRSRCRDNGIGEIYLAYTQSFDSVAPARYGFDAAIEFPPNVTQPPPVTDRVQAVQDDFAGQVFDWSIYPTRSANYRKPGYKLFRGVCPSWDNTARRKNRGTSFINSSPRGYQEWLFNAMQDTLEREPASDHRLVFINAWNEWAEGAHLEPDQRHGYGFLEATRMACVRAALQRQPASERTERLAVVIHAYYPNVLTEIVSRLNQVEGLALQLYLSCPPDKARVVRGIMASCRHPWRLEELANRGRDVLPFLKLLPRVIADGHSVLLKVHTKKSTHREDGDVWCRDLYDKLLSEEAMCRALDSFAHTPAIGIIGPAGHLVPMSYYWGSNARAVERLACRLGIRSSQLAELDFVAGTMFFAQVRALQPLLHLALSDDDFEAEAGQVDGTFAHALERAMSVSAKAAGFDVKAAGPAVDRSYAFAEASR